MQTRGLDTPERLVYNEQAPIEIVRNPNFFGDGYAKEVNPARLLDKEVRGILQVRTEIREKS
jgi:hypothetical protein